MLQLLLAVSRPPDLAKNRRISWENDIKYTHTNSSTSGEFFRQVRCFFPHCHAITSSLTQLIAAVPAVPLDPCHHRSAGRSLAPGVAGHGVLEGAQGQLFQVEERSQELDVLSTVPGRFQPKKRGWSVCWKMRFFFPYFLGQI